MPRRTIAEFRKERAAGQERLAAADHLGINRFLALDSGAYRDATEKGGLPSDVKELLGLVASTVLRCNDCIDYHLEQCAAQGWTRAQIADALNVAMVVGGSITIPHLRHAMHTLDELFAEGGRDQSVAEV